MVRVGGASSHGGVWVEVALAPRCCPRMLSFVDIECSATSAAEVEQAATVEAQETANLRLYEQALGLQCNGDLTAAAAAYRELLAQELLVHATRVPADAPRQRRDGDRPSLQLKFLALKNLSEVEEAAGAEDSALTLLLEAIQMQDDDAVLWQRLGAISLRLGRLHLARLALEQAVACSPHHQLAARRLSELLSSLGDAAALTQLHVASKRRLPHLAPHLLPPGQSAGARALSLPPAPSEAQESGGRLLAGGATGRSLPEEDASGNDTPVSKRRRLDGSCTSSGGSQGGQVQPAEAAEPLQTPLANVSWAAVADALGAVWRRLVMGSPEDVGGPDSGREAEGVGGTRGNGGARCLLGHTLRLVLPPPPLPQITEQKAAAATVPPPPTASAAGSDDTSTSIDYVAVVPATISTAVSTPVAMAEATHATSSALIVAADIGVAADGGGAIDVEMQERGGGADSSQVKSSQVRVAADDGGAIDVEMEERGGGVDMGSTLEVDAKANGQPTSANNEYMEFFGLRGGDHALQETATAVSHGALRATGGIATVGSAAAAAPADTDTDGAAATSSLDIAAAAAGTAADDGAVTTADGVTGGAVGAATAADGAIDGEGASADGVATADEGAQGLPFLAAAVGDSTSADAPTDSLVELGQPDDPQLAGPQPAGSQPAGSQPERVRKLPARISRGKSARLIETHEARSVAATSSSLSAPTALPHALELRRLLGHYTSNASPSPPCACPHTTAATAAGSKAASSNGASTADAELPATLAHTAGAPDFASPPPWLTELKGEPAVCGAGAVGADAVIQSATAHLPRLLKSSQAKPSQVKPSQVLTPSERQRSQAMIEPTSPGPYATLMLTSREPHVILIGQV